MSRINSKEGNGTRTLQTRLFRAYLTVIGIVLVFFSLFFFLFVSSLLISNEEEALMTLNSSVMDQVDSVIRDLDVTSANINYSSLMSDNLDSSFNLMLTDSGLTRLAALFVTINGSDIKADQINLYDFRGNRVKVGMVTNTDKVKLAELEWYEPARSLNGLKLISLPYRTDVYSTGGASSDWYLSVYRTCSNPYGRKVGMIETLKRCKSVFKSIISYSKKSKDGASVYVFNQDGILVYPYDVTFADAEPLSAYYRATLSARDRALVRSPLHNHRERLVFAKSSYSGWTFITVQREGVILRPLYKLVLVLLGALLGILGLAVLISLYVSRSLARPIIRLKSIIQDMALDTLGVKSPLPYQSGYQELNELYRVFEATSHKLKISLGELIDSRQQELKSRSLALQNQTNPHFYYNTLSCIIVLAENGKRDEVIRLCRNITQMMRYITDGSSLSVPLSEEISYIRKYLYCMEVRYQSSLRFTLDVDEALLDLSVPRLIIQPLVENALKYGTDCLPPWHISVTGRLYPDRWQIDVTDSGKGFTEEALRMLEERIREADANPGMPELKIDGLGILNVYMRLKIFCRENTLFFIGNTQDGHGIVSIGCRLDQASRTARSPADSHRHPHTEKEKDI